ncbi:hypothetical protein ABZ499_09620 [Streptomyces sp. NPDC019990]|uniref:hypothetical protein n=1 Tax=Streptomyces sp. NPDC019990 TaxID=3154693 RepID=UPI003407BA30
MSALPAVVARRAATADVTARNITSGVRVVPEIDADFGSDSDLLMLGSFPIYAVCAVTDIPCGVPGRPPGPLSQPPA